MPTILSAKTRVTCPRTLLCLAAGMVVFEFTIQLYAIIVFKNGSVMPMHRKVYDKLCSVVRRFNEIACTFVFGFYIKL